jgi:hypothetical protein
MMITSAVPVTPNVSVQRPAPAGEARRSGPLQLMVRRHHSRPSNLEVFWRKSRVLGDSRQHPWTDLFTVVKREDEIGPALAGQRAVGAGLAFDLPTDAVKCR